MSTESSERPADRFAFLYSLSQRFNSSLDLDDVLNRVMDEVILATRAERGFVTLREPDGELVFRIARGMDQATIEEPQFEISHSVVDEVAKSGEPILTSNAQEDERFRSRTSVIFLGLRSIICAPLKVKDSVIGVIYVENRIQSGIFTRNDLELLAAIAGSAAIAIENARLYQVAVEKGRMERELQMAYRVQSSLIPEETPRYPGWEFAAHWQPARVVAGDYYDFIPTQDGRTGIVIADVTDKGMPAALFMALTRSIVRACMDQTLSPADSINKANRLICADSTSHMPVTLFYGLLDPKGGELTYVNAGHNPPILYRSHSDEFDKLDRTGMFLGFDHEATYKQRIQVIKPGDFVVFYTDGVTDASDADKQRFGQGRFEGLLADHRMASAEEVLTILKETLKDFMGGTAPYDDITLLVAKRLKA
jgi:sigma-B regulation protein RsbU (phosphoserine phosphatase)